MIVNQIENQTLLVIRDYSLSLVNPRGCASKPLKSQLLGNFIFFISQCLQKLDIGEYTPRRMNPGGNVNQIENQTLLVIRDYSLRS